MSSKKVRATLALADGTVFHGESVGVEGEAIGEVVFNTSMTGYQEVLTDPSYAYQLLTFTYPHIGNQGINPEDFESKKVQVAGAIMHSFSKHDSNFRRSKSLNELFIESGVVAISGIDTRSLVLRLRDQGAQMGVIATGERSVAELVDIAKNAKSMEGLNLAAKVSTSEKYTWSQGVWELGKGYSEYATEELAIRPHVVALDFGIKYNILRLLLAQGFRVTVLPYNATRETVLGLAPDGVFLSNGPGDPAAVTEGIECVKGLLGKVPIFGICLGHQILGHALGAPTFKLPFGHRGGNHPVRDEKTGKVSITSQNHGFATQRTSVPKNVFVSHINLNDQTVEGLYCEEAKAFSVQYHPEASPGPHDARNLFNNFYELVSRA